MTVWQEEQDFLKYYHYFTIYFFFNLRFQKLLDSTDEISTFAKKQRQAQPGIEMLSYLF